MTRFLTIRADDADWLYRELTFRKDDNMRRRSFVHPASRDELERTIEAQSRILEAIRDAE